MNFEYTEEQKAVRNAARDFAQSELLPGVIERDTHQKLILVSTYPTRMKAAIARIRA